MSGDFLPAKVRTGIRLRCAFCHSLKLRIVCEPKGLPFMVSSITTSSKCPGQVRALNYLGECRAGAFMAHP
jgi:hypothetical protein